MNDDFDYVEAKYTETFDSVYYSLAQQKKAGTVTKDSLTLLLQDQYLYYDQDMYGRSAIRNAAIEATIAAIQVHIVEWDEVEDELELLA